MAMEGVLQNVMWCCENFKNTYILSRKKTASGRPLKKEAHEGARLWSAMSMAYIKIEPTPLQSVLSN